MISILLAISTVKAMHFSFLLLISFLNVSLELPNGFEIEVPPPKSDYSDWYDIFYKPSPIVPLLRSNEKVYFIGKYFRANFLQAQLFCKIMNMNLITISSKEDDKEIKTILQKNGIAGDYWTSATRMLDGKTWIWMYTAKPVEYVNWGPFQPNNKNDHCILITKTNDDFIWNDRNCNCRFLFICEKQIIQSIAYLSRSYDSRIRKYYGTYFD